MCPSFNEEDITQEEKDEIIEKAAKKIFQYQMETLAILTLESIKPFVYIGGEMGRVMLAPFLLALGSDFNKAGEKLLTIFEDKDNIEKLIQILEKKIIEEEIDKKKKKEERIEDKLENKKKGWFKWRFIQNSTI